MSNMNETIFGTAYMVGKDEYVEGSVNLYNCMG